MKRVRSKGSSIEKTLERLLRQHHLSFKKQYAVHGRPDFVLLKDKIALFCDSHFWHGYKWPARKNEIKSNKPFWFKKIAANMKRDKTVNRLLKKDGWTVIRFWEHNIIHSPEKCVLRIKNARREHQA